MLLSVTPEEGPPVEDVGEVSLAAVVTELHAFIQQTWPDGHDEQPWDKGQMDVLRDIKTRATRATASSPRSPTHPGPAPHSHYTISPAAAAVLAGTALLPPAAYLAAHPGTTNLLASAAVFHRQRVLLVQRAPADFFPLKWELPGGSVDVGGGGVGDGTVVAGAVRELWEETGLVARLVRRGCGERGFEGGRWRQAVFEVGIEVEVGEEGDEGGWPLVKLDVEEHVAYLWVSVEEVEEGRCGEVELEYADPEWRELLLRAFELHRVGEGLRPFGLDGFW